MYSVQRKISADQSLEGDQARPARSAVEHSTWRSRLQSPAGIKNSLQKSLSLQRKLPCNPFTDSWSIIQELCKQARYPNSATRQPLIKCKLFSRGKLLAKPNCSLPLPSKKTKNKAKLSCGKGVHSGSPKVNNFRFLRLRFQFNIMSKIMKTDTFDQEVTKRCRLSWPTTAPSYMSPNAGGRGGGVTGS
jgi:hypothetical protein